jgi:hypothetical protein
MLRREIIAVLSKSKEVKNPQTKYSLGENAEQALHRVTTVIKGLILI